MLPVITLSAIDRGASTAIAALIGALLGIGSIVTNIPSGILATRIGERKIDARGRGRTVAGLALCLVNLGRGAGVAAEFGFGVLLHRRGQLGLHSRPAVVPDRDGAAADARPGAVDPRRHPPHRGVPGPFLGAGAMQLWGLPGAYYVSLAAIVAAGVIVYRVPDLEMSDQHRAAAAQVTTWSILKQYWRTFVTLGDRRPAAVGHQADPAGGHPAVGGAHRAVAHGELGHLRRRGAIDALTFYPAGKVMDVYGRRWVAVPCVIIMGISFVLMPLTHAAVTLALTAMIMGFGNGIGSGIVMTLAADVSPAIGRPRSSASGAS